MGRDGRWRCKKNKSDKDEIQLEAGRKHYGNHKPNHFTPRWPQGAALPTHHSSKPNWNSDISRHKSHHSTTYHPYESSRKAWRHTASTYNSKELNAGEPPSRSIKRKIPHEPPLNSKRLPPPQQEHARKEAPGAAKKH